MARFPSPMMPAAGLGSASFSFLEPHSPGGTSGPTWLWHLPVEHSLGDKGGSCLWCQLCVPVTARGDDKLADGGPSQSHSLGAFTGSDCDLPACLCGALGALWVQWV